MQYGRFVVAFLAIALIGTACAPPPSSTTPSASTSASQPAEAPKPAAPKHITAAIRGDPHTLSEAANVAAGGSSSAGVRELEQLVNAGLLLADNTGELRPLLAEQAPTLESGLWKVNPDGTMETTWKLKPNLKWHDGQPLTTDDFVFTATIARDKAITMAQDVSWSFVDTVEALDPQTIRVSWKSTYVDADKLFSQTNVTRMPPMPKHLLDAPYQADKANLTQAPFFTAGYIGMGPYRVKDWQLGSFLILEASDNFVLGRPKIDQIEVKFILDTNTMVSNMLAGAVQITLGRGLTPEQAITVRDQWKEGKVDAGLQNTTSLYPQFINAEPAVLTDARFRRALLMGLDRQQMVDSFLSGLVPVADSQISPDEPNYQTMQPYIVKYTYDPRQAMAQLDGMGLTKGDDGFYRDASGQKLSVEVRTRSHVLREKVQQVIADEWAKIGIVGQPLVVPEQNINDRAYQSTFPGFYFRFGDPSQMTDARSTEVPLPENNFVGRNIVRYRNAELDSIINRYVSTIPKNDRENLLGEMVHHYTDQLVLLTLYHEPEPVLISNRMMNAAGRKGISIQTWNVYDWDLKS